MKVMLTEMHSIRDSLRTMYMSKRTWNQELEKQLKEMVDHCTDRYGKPLDYLPEDDELKIKFDKEVAKLLKWGQKHITMLRFEDISVVVEGLHRGATDDLDSHAKRMDNRIIRSSTRLADYHEGETRRQNGNHSGRFPCGRPGLQRPARSFGEFSFVGFHVFERRSRHGAHGRCVEPGSPGKEGPEGRYRAVGETAHDGHGRVGSCEWHG